MEVWLRRCETFDEEQQADAEFWRRMSPDERVNVLEQMRQEWLVMNGRGNEGLRRIARMFDAPPR